MSLLNLVGRRYKWKEFIFCYTSSNSNNKEFPYAYGNMKTLQSEPYNLYLCNGAHISGRASSVRDRPDILDGWNSKYNRYVILIHINFFCA